MKKSLLLGLPLAVLTAGLVTSLAYAASLTSFSDTLSNATISAVSSHTIKFTTPSGASSAEQTIIITFPSDFNFTSKAIASVTFTHGPTTGTENTETLAASPSTTAWGAVFSGTQNRILTLTAPTDGVGTAAVAAGDKVIITYTSANSNNASTPGNYAVTVAGTFNDSGTTTVPILTNDQVSISATVPQSLTFTISSNTIGFGSLSTSASRYATADGAGSATETEAHQLVAGTNAPTGYTISVVGPSLSSGAYSIDPVGGTNTAPTTGTEQFGLRMTASGGTGAVSSPYAASGFAYNAATSPATVASASGATTNTTYSVRYLANVAPLTESGVYTTSLTYEITPNF